MQISQKSHYALHALFELARRGGAAPLTIQEIAEAQAIPPQFLQAILRELRQAGFVESRRGKAGGYLLAREPRQITVGAVLRFIEGSLAPADGVDETGRPANAKMATCPFLPVWAAAAETMSALYERYTLADIVEMSRGHGGGCAGAEYVI